jgi:hypothetical protein
VQLLRNGATHTSFSVTNPVTDGNEPIALPIKVPGDCATKSFPLPTGRLSVDVGASVGEDAS